MLIIIINSVVLASIQEEARLKNSFLSYELLENNQNAKLTEVSGMKQSMRFGDILWEVCEFSKY